MSWIHSQHRAMARWVGSKVGQPVEDLTKDLNDGLLLAKLVNVIAEECGTSEYILLPIHKKPTLPLQKVENIDDVLKFCRLILQINTSSVSAENVVDGDLKLILGLIWTFFVYATLTLISIANEGNLITEIKRILLRWVNSIGRSCVLPEITNFSQDWSLQTNLRPDLIFAAICDYYLPNALVDFDKFKISTPVANLDTVFSQADLKLQIPQLMVLEDFNVLVPDEKSILLCLLQWYTFFELTPDMLDPPVVAQQELENSNTLGQFVQLCLEALRAKRSYEAKALRLVDQVNANIVKLSNLNEELCLTIVPVDLALQLDAFCGDIQKTRIEDQLSSRTQYAQISMFGQFFVDLLTAYEHFSLQLMPTYLHHDFPEIQTLFKSVSVNLSKTGIPSFQPEKNVALSTIATRLECLKELESIVGEKMLEVLDLLCGSKVANIDTLLVTLEDHLHCLGKEPVQPILKNYVDQLSLVMELKQHMDRFLSVLKPKHNARKLRILVDSLDTLDVCETPKTPTTQQTMAFEEFKSIVAKQQNKLNLTHADLTKFIDGLAELPKGDKKEFILLVPSRRMLNRSESDEFSLYGLDENASVNEEALFDKVQLTMEQKLAGTYNKLYDLAEFVERLQGGFSV